MLQIILLAIKRLKILYVNFKKGREGSNRFLKILMGVWEQKSLKAGVSVGRRDICWSPEIQILPFSSSATLRN